MILKRLSTGLAGLACLIAAGCAEQARNVPATYIPSLVYRGATCAELQREQQTLYAYVQHVTLAQRNAAQWDTAGVFVGTLIAWPALFALPLTVDQEAQLASARGHYDALLRAMQEQGCSGGSYNPGQVRSSYAAPVSQSHHPDWKRYSGQFPPL